MDTQEIINNIKSAFSDFDFPSHKKDIINHAENKGIAEEIINMLKQLPEQSFQSIEDMLSNLSLGNIGSKIDEFFDE